VMKAAPKDAGSEFWKKFKWFLIVLLRSHPWSGADPCSWTQQWPSRQADCQDLWRGVI
jgi:hypothetical protein